MVDKVFVTDANALLLGRDAALGQVADDAVQKVVNICHRLPRSEGNVHLAVMLKELGLAVRALETQRVKKGTLIWRDRHLLLVDTDLQLGKACFFLHGPEFGNLHNTLQIVWNENSYIYYCPRNIFTSTCILVFTFLRGALHAVNAHLFHCSGAALSKIPKANK